MTVSEKTAVELSCGHSREIPAEYVTVVGINGTLFCLECQRPRKKKESGR